MTPLASPLATPTVDRCACDCVLIRGASTMFGEPGQVLVERADVPRLLEQLAAAVKETP